MIPKIIHFCWFGGNKMPPLAKKCIRSWKKFCSEYEIIKWDETNFDISKSPTYVQEAYNAKKWAFVTDYVRLWALFKYGGIYMDTDVEVIRPLDIFLTESAFSGFENNTQIPTGIMAAEKGHTLFRKWLDDYDVRHFINEDGSMDMTTNVVAITSSMKDSGMLFNNTKQTVNGMTFYPNDFFCPKEFNTGIIRVTSNTYTIHHFNASWQDKKMRKKTKQRRAYTRSERRKIKLRSTIKSIIGQDAYDELKRLFKRK